MKVGKERTEEEEEKTALGKIRTHDLQINQQVNHTDQSILYHLWGARGKHSTEVAFALLTQQPRV